MQSITSFLTATALLALPTFANPVPGFTWFDDSTTESESVSTTTTTTTVTTTSNYTLNYTTTTTYTPTATYINATSTHHYKSDDYTSDIWKREQKVEVVTVYV